MALLRYITYGVLGIVTASAAIHVARPRSSPPPAGYIDSKLCDACHMDRARTYRLTGMGRSFYRPRPENTVEDYSRDNSYYHEPSLTRFTMLQRDGNYY